MSKPRVAQPLALSLAIFGTQRLAASVGRLE
jgi:hypothetical protein